MAESRLGEVVVCQLCQQPLRARVPDGTLLVEKNGQVVEAADALGRRNEEEQTVARIYPAALRQNPLQSAILLVMMLGGLALLVWVWTGTMEPGGLKTTLLILGALLVVAGLATLGARMIAARFEALRITTQRTIWSRGFIQRRTSEVQHDDIRNIQLTQGVVERLLGVGGVAVSSAGQDDMEIHARGIPNPQKVIDTIRKHQRRLVGGD